MQSGRGVPGLRGWLVPACAAILAAVLCSVGLAASSGGRGSWLVYGAGATRAGAVSGRSTRLERAFVLALPGRITGQVLASGGRFYVATSAGEVQAFDSDGSPVWSADLGQFAHSCPMLDGYGVTGTGAIDPATGSLLLADGFGRVHALSLSSGAERAGWPVRAYDDPDRELDWGALALLGRSLYVPTASYCDEPMIGGVFAVDLQTRKVGHWISVPASLGGGGGVWGWGGVASAGGDLYVVTANALKGGQNTGNAFSETAGYGEHVVRLSSGLRVEDSDAPPGLGAGGDLDFVGSPVLVDRQGCGRLAVAADKNDVVYGWRAGDLARGPLWHLQLQPYDVADPLLSQLAWSAATSSIYVVTGTSFDRVAIAADCSARIVWRRALGTKTENGSPTIAGNTVWFAVNGLDLLVGYDAGTGRRLDSVPLGGTTFSAPTIVDGTLVVGTFTGLVEGFALGGASPVPAARLIARSGSWRSTPAGVFAGGVRIYPLPAQALAQVSRSSGVIQVGVDPDRCMCRLRLLWTNDGGRTWRRTGVVGGEFIPAAGAVWWWSGGTLERTVLPTGAGRPRSVRVYSDRSATVVDAAPVAGGVAELLSSRVDGQGWDTSPRVAVARGGRVQVVQLPTRSGQILAQDVRAKGSTLTVTGTDFGSDPVRAVTWTLALPGA